MAKKKTPHKELTPEERHERVKASKRKWHNANADKVKQYKADVKSGKRIPKPRKGSKIHKEVLRKAKTKWQNKSNQNKAQQERLERNRKYLEDYGKPNNGNS